MYKTLTILAGGLLILGMIGCGDSTTIQGPGGKELTVTVPSEVELTRGHQQSISIELDRKGFTDPVDVSLSNLPDGVEAQADSKSVSSDVATFVLLVDSDADLVAGHAVNLTVEGPDGMSMVKTIPMAVVSR
ncbi:MAG: hypothetical protein ACLFUJ_10985 [Phycisphaerae bacterium]